MKKLIVLSYLCTLAVAFPLVGSYENVKKVNATAGMSTWTIARKFSRLGDEITPTPLFSTDSTITASGSYVLAEDLTTPLTISANDVCLDLGCHSMTVSTNYAITVSPGRSNIRIHNGVLYNGGVFVSAGCSNVDIHSLSINAPLTGVNCDLGCSNIFMAELVITNAQANGIYLNSGCSKVNLNDIALSLPSAVGAAVHVNDGCADLAMKSLRISGAAPVGLYVNTGCVGLILQDSTIQTTAYGVQVLANCGGINLKDTIISGPGIGVVFDGTTPSATIVTACSLSGVKCINVTEGFKFDNVESCIVKDSHVMSASRYGFNLDNCRSNCFYDCSSLRMSGSGEVAGFKSNAGTSNMFQRCVVKQAFTSSPTFGDTSNGFMLRGTESKTKIVDSVVNDVIASTQYTVAYGINMKPILQPGVTLKTTPLTVGFGFRKLEWSPLSEYVAAVTTSNNVYIYHYNASAGTLLNKVTVPGTNNYDSVAWSPDGKYLAVGNSSDTTVKVYSFDGVFATLAASYPATEAGTISWSPNGKFIAVGQVDLSGGTNGILRILSFNGTALSDVWSAIFTTSVAGMIWAAWAPDGSAVAVTANGNANIMVFPVSSAGSLSNPISFPGIVGADLRYPHWSPCGRYIAFNKWQDWIRVYQWNGTSISLIVEASSAVTEAISWSPDGKYIIGAQNAGADIYTFTGSGLSYYSTYAIAGNGENSALSPDGRLLAYVSYNGVNNDLIIYSIMDSPSRCLVDNCRVCDVNAANYNLGRGYLGYTNNLFTRNIAGNNGINYSYGIPNAYDGRFELYPGRSTAQPFDNVSMPTTL